MNPDAAAQSSTISEGTRLTGVFHSPGSVFGDIARNGRWWIPLLILTVISVCVVTAAQQRVPIEKMIDRLMETNERMQQLPADQRERVIEQQRKFLPMGMYAGALLGNAVTLFVAAGALLFVFNLLLDASMKYKNVLNITSYAFLPPSIVGAAALLVVLYLKPPDEFDFQTALAFNAGAFLPDGASAWLKALASSIDLFSFWTIALLAIGFSRAVPKMTVGRAVGGIVIPWLLWVVVKTGWMAIFG